MTNEEAWQRIKRSIYGISDSDILSEAVERVEEALEKQIPKKPILHPFFEYGEDYSYYKCPNGCRYVALTIGDSYCRRCGQAIDWSDIND